MKSLKTKKVVAVALAVVLTLALSLTAFAYDWPSNVRDWSDKDWRAWEDSMNAWYEEEEEEHEREREREKEAYSDKESEYSREYSRDYDRDYEHTVEAYVYEEPEVVYTYTYNTGTGTTTYPVATNTGVISNVNYNTNNGVITNANNAAGVNRNYYNGLITEAYDANTEGDAVILAKIMHQYAHGVQSMTAQACVAWAVLNSKDASGSGTSLAAVAANFGYNAGESTIDDYGRDMILLGRDIMLRYKAGKNGVSANGRVLPANYMYVWSTGNFVVFRNTPSESGAAWNYSLASPYGN